MDGARSLNGARMGGITTLDDARQLQDFITAGLTPEEHHRFLDLQGGPEFFAYLIKLPEPLRLADFSGHTRAVGLLEIDSPLGPRRSSSRPPTKKAPTLRRGTVHSLPWSLLRGRAREGARVGRLLDV